jgi:hypothetical protein
MRRWLSPVAIAFMELAGAAASSSSALFNRPPAIDRTQSLEIDPA